MPQRMKFQEAPCQKPVSAQTIQILRMCLPLVVCAVSVIVLGFCSEPLIDFFQAVALGLE